ncbi:hypothetical protein [Pseudoduganella lutea]|uniref:Uncharacterized protein n=1 Tax=Pseudoduganella lutea TaxID=321985 RepID=A0A4P6L298_9BURK|nr:hypothetical protein [Pseudoduganella lutea]QBE64908.1 hypothetical protein EWM63_19490 [Pseudoduganella lutea]
MQSNRVANGFGIFMLIGSVPWILAIATFVQIMIAHSEAKSSGGNALGLMIMSISAYGIALVSFVSGVIYFTYAALRKKESPKRWQWLTIGYSICLLIIPIIFFFSQ